MNYGEIQTLIEDFKEEYRVKTQRNSLNQVTDADVLNCLKAYIALIEPVRVYLESTSSFDYTVALYSLQHDDASEILSVYLAHIDNRKAFSEQVRELDAERQLDAFLKFLDPKGIYRTIDCIKRVFSLYSYLEVLVKQYE